MTSWSDHTEDTTTFSLRHLWPFVHTYRRGGEGTGQPLEEYRVVVLFSDHCFTGVDASKGDTTLLGTYAQSKDGRRFSEKRHRLSARLPDLVRHFPAARCLTTHPDYLVLDLDSGEGDGRYEIYFKVVLTPSGMLQLIVKSAYFRTADRIEHAPHTYKPTGFFTILHKATRSGRR